MVYSVAFLGFQVALADCTLTTSPGTNGRCFIQDGEYVCLDREEDTNCKTKINVT